MASDKKRKTFTSTEVKTRYNNKTYNRYTVSFRLKEDADIIAIIEAEQAKGKNTTEIFRELLQNSIK